MKIAILFTGAYRTLDRTHIFIRKQLLEPNDATSFIFCQTNKSNDEFYILMKQRWGPYFGSSVAVESTRTSEYNNLLKYLLETKPAISEQEMNKFGFTQHYFSSGGAILEYFQFLKVYQMMLEYERIHDVHFDIIIRSRLDVVLNEPLLIGSFFEHCNEPLLNNYGEEIYIRSLGNEHIARLISQKKIKSYHYFDSFPSNDSNSNENHLPSNDPNEIMKKIHTKDYLWTFYCNWLWIGKRHVMDKLYPLVFFYGSYDVNKFHNFNPEIQYYEYCKNHNIELLYFCTEYDFQLFQFQQKTFYFLIDDQGNFNPEINHDEFTIGLCRWPERF